MSRASQIWKQYQGTIMGRRIVVEQAIAALFGSGLTDSMRRNAEREADKLASLVGSYGFGMAARVAREIANIMAGGLGTARSQGSRLLELLTTLRRELDRIPETSDEPSETSIRVLIVDHNAGYSESLSMEGMKLGMTTEAAYELSDAFKAIATLDPHLILVDLYFPSGRDESLKFIRDVATSHPGLPVIALSATDDFEDRLLVSQAGGAGFLRKAMPVREIIQLAFRRWQQVSDEMEITGLLVTTDRQLAQRVHQGFEASGHRVQSDGNARHVWDALSLANPDLLLVDAEFNEPSALDLCRLIRNESRWSTIPILSLHHRPTEAAQSECIRAGFDDCIERELPAADLFDQVRLRMKRVQIYRAFGQIDSLTGVSNIKHSTQLMQQLLRIAERQRQPFCLMVIGIDQIERIRREEGPAVADGVQHRLAQLLIRFFRTEDVVARWSGDTFVVALFGIDRDRAVSRAQQLLQRITQNPFPEPEWAETRVTLSAGLAQYPVDGDTLTALHQSADHAHELAHKNGGNRALRSGEPPTHGPLLERVNVVIVDANVDSIGPVVQALQDDKLTLRWLRSGEEAIRSLTGTSRSVGTSVVLLATQLPDVDGFTVFRQLLREVVVRRVILLADQPSQDEVLTALQLGAFDYITRPLDVEALLERIRSALEAD